MIDKNYLLVPRSALFAVRHSLDIPSVLVIRFRANGAIILNAPNAIWISLKRAFGAHIDSI